MHGVSQAINSRANCSRRSVSPTTFLLLRRQVRWPRHFRSFLQIRAECAPSSLVSRESYDHRSCRAPTWIKCMLLATGLPTRFSGTLASLWSGIRAQPQRDVGGLHRPAHDPDEVVLQGVEIRLVSKLGREARKRLFSIVLPTVEAAVDKALDAAPQRVEQGGYRQSGDHHHKLGSFAG